MKRINKIFKTMFLILLASMLVLSLSIGGTLYYLSPGMPEPFKNEDGKPMEGSISEKVFLNIGGVKQGMFIKSKNKRNSVLLYVHGGIPDYFLTQNYPTGIEDNFTMVWWEQRGSGLSYSADIPAESMNLAQLISDTKEVTNYLRNRFGQDKIYLMGRSGGTFIGIQVAADSPELYHAYIGVGQMSDQLKSERLAYEFMLKEYKEAGNRNMVQKLESSPITDSIPYAYLKLRDPAMHSLGIGTTHDMKSVQRGIFLPSLTFREYTLKEKFNLWRGKAKTGVHPLWNIMVATDLSEEVNEIDIPVYFFHGKYDYTVSYSLAKKYFEALHAPVKGFYTFENSAHSPIFEDPERIKQILEQDVLVGTYGLADR